MVLVWLCLLDDGSAHALKDHLDYVPEEHIKKQIWHSVGPYYDISISSDFFKS